MRFRFAPPLAALCFMMGGFSAVFADPTAAFVNAVPPLTPAPTPPTDDTSEPNAPVPGASMPTPADGVTPFNPAPPMTFQNLPTPVYGYRHVQRFDSYEAVTEQHPAPAHSLTPPALLTGPAFRGAGRWGGAYGGGTHIRFPYYNYRSPWTYGGPASVNHTIHW